MDSTALQALVVGYYIFEWVLRILALFVVPRNRTPAAGMSWLMVIFLIPPVGWAAFLVFGSRRLPKNRRDAQRVVEEHMGQVMKSFGARWAKAAQRLQAEPSKKYQAVAQLSKNLTQLTVLGCNDIEPIASYDAVFDRMIVDIDAAHDFVHVEYYILALDTATEPFFAALERATARGVAVRVLYDAFGSRKFPGRKAMLLRLKKSGISVQAMLPLRMLGKGYVRPDLRNHRKIVVIDGQVGYTGSQNMIQRDYHRNDSIVYDELVVRITGPVVLQLEAIFLTDWHAETAAVLPESQAAMSRGMKESTGGSSRAQVIPSGPGYEYENNLRVFTSVLYAAQKTITIVNPYFVPDPALAMALANAAQRGVRVRLYNSAAVDQAIVAHAQRSYYEQMLRAGVEIYLYDAPVLLHSKYIIIDDDAVLIGSSNMDIRSFELNHELTLAVYDTALVARIEAITEVYRSRSHQVHKDEWAKRPPRKQLLDNLARLTSSLQ